MDIVAGAGLLCALVGFIMMWVILAIKRKNFADIGDMLKNNDTLMIIAVALESGGFGILFLGLIVHTFLKHYTKQRTSSPAS